MNILSTNGIVGRYVTDWTGPGAVLTDVNIRLGAPNYPDDTMTLTGSVTAKDDRPDPTARGGGGVSVRGANGLGDHVTGTVRCCCPRRRRGHRRPADERRRHAFTGNTAIVGHRGHRVLQGVRPQRAAPGRRGRGPGPRDAGIEPAEVDGMVTFSSDTNPEIEIARSLGMGELSFFSRIHYGGVRGAPPSNRPPWPSPGRGGRRGGLLPGLQRALGQPVRRRGAGPPAGSQRRDGQLRLVRTLRSADAGPVGGHGRPALPPRVRGHLRGPGVGWRWPTASMRPPTRRPGSTRSPSPSRSTRRRVGSSSPSTCSTAARRPTVARPWWSPRSSGPATCRPRRWSSRRPPKGPAPVRR